MEDRKQNELDKVELDSADAKPISEKRDAKPISATPLSIAALVAGSEDRKEDIERGRSDAKALIDHKPGRVLNGFPPLIDAKTLDPLTQKALDTLEKTSTIRSELEAELSDELRDELAEGGPEMEFRTLITQAINGDNFGKYPATRQMMEIYDQIINLGCLYLLDDAKTIKPTVCQAILDTPVTKLQCTELISSFVENVSSAVSVCLRDDLVKNLMLKFGLTQERVSQFESIQQLIKDKKNKLNQQIQVTDRLLKASHKDDEEKKKLLTELQNDLPKLESELVSELKKNAFDQTFIENYTNFIKSRDTLMDKWAALSTSAQKVWTDSAKAFENYVQEKIKTFPFQKIKEEKLKTSPKIKEEKITEINEIKIMLEKKKNELESLLKEKKDLPEEDSEKINDDIQQLASALGNIDRPLNEFKISKQVQNLNKIMIILFNLHKSEIINLSDTPELLNQVIAASYAEMLDKYKKMDDELKLTPDSNDSKSILNAVKDTEKHHLIKKIIHTLQGKGIDMDAKIKELILFKKFALASKFDDIELALTEDIAKLVSLISSQISSEEKSEVKIAGKRAAFKMADDAEFKPIERPRPLQTALNKIKEDLSKILTTNDPKEEINATRRTLVVDSICKINRFLKGQDDNYNFVDLLTDLNALRDVRKRNTGPGLSGLFLDLRLYQMKNNMEKLKLFLSSEEKIQFNERINKEASLDKKGENKEEPATPPATPPTAAAPKKR